MNTVTTTRWDIDLAHSEIQFKIKHLVISTVTGEFTNFTGTLEHDSDDFEGAQASFEADVSSIDTNNAQRDGHLKSADFFDVENYPKLKFSSNKFEKVDDETFKLHGDLTIKDITNAVTLDVDFGGIAEDPFGQTKAGFDVSGKINRKKFGLTWDGVTEAGNVVVSDTVKLLISVQFTKVEE